MSKQAAMAGISAREAEVLSLVGEHRSNAEIAARLVISVRTVETHVSSLLRKLGVPDRRALADLAAEMERAERISQAQAGLPSPVSPFIGRARERAELRNAVLSHRQVTAVGPGGVGKTRLALAVAEDLAGDFADGVWFVDLVPVTDPAMVGAAVAAALGVGERQGRSIDDSLLAAVTDRHTLLVLDNCEHLAEGVAPLVERLLARGPRVRVLATSRARLAVPYERVYAVPPLSFEGGGAGGGGTRGPEADGSGPGGPPDAVSLFLDRAAAVGWTLGPEHLDQVADVCRKLDGVALAIELAAARLPALGLDGLVAGLSDHLRLLVGGYRADERHRSVRAMLEWSEALLDDTDLAVLRRASVFVSPFTAAAAVEVAGFDPLGSDEVVAGLARLADQSLLTAAPSAGGTRYRALETIRQYGTERLADAGELDAARDRHLRWCLATAEALADAEDPAPGSGEWRAGFDAVADDLRAALSWAAGRADRHADAHRLALALARLAFDRNLIGESQQRYEQAAALAGAPAPARPTGSPSSSPSGGPPGCAGSGGSPGPSRSGAASTGPAGSGGSPGPSRSGGSGTDPGGAAAALRGAANVAACRMRGDDAYRLWRTAADVALGAGDTAAAARDLATAATTCFRKAGTFAGQPPGDEALALLARARELAGDDLAAQAAVAVADCAALGYAYFAKQATRAGAGPGPGGGEASTEPDTGDHTDASTEPSRGGLAEATAGADPGGGEATTSEATTTADRGAGGEANAGSDAGSGTGMAARAERAVELAHRLGDPLAECAALWALTGAQRRAGDTFAAAATARRRVELLESGPVTPATADELIDALLIATATSIGVGDLAAARRWGRQLAELPPLAEVGHVATSRLLMADALAGRAADVVAASARFLDGWTQVGRPPARGFGPVAAAVAMIHGLRGDDDARAEWLDVLDQLGVTAADRSGYSPTFDAIALLHRGQAAQARARLDGRDDEPKLWDTGILLHWHVALRAEAAVLAGDADAGEVVAAACPVVAGNPIASAIVDRAAALASGGGPDREAVLATAAVFEAAGCPYQRARTLLLAGPDHAPAGEALLADLGVPPPTT